MSEAVKERFKRTLIAAFCLLLAALPAQGCAGREPNYPVSVGGATLEDYPTAVVSLSPYLSEIVYELELPGLLVGRSTHCAFNGNVRGLPDAGTVLEPDTEAIIKLAPQLVLAASPLPESARASLEKAGIGVCVLSVPESAAGVRQRVLEVAKLLRGLNRAPLAAEKCLAEFDRTLDETARKLEGVKKPTAVFILSDQGAVATGDTLAGQLMEMAGAVNIAASRTGYEMSFDEIAAADPDIVIVSSEPSPDYLYTGDFSVLSAVKSGMVYEIDNSLAESHALSSAGLLKSIAFALHGEAMSKELPPETK